jgi:hypothetical protein
MSDMRISIPEWDFILGWGAFGSPTDAVMQHLHKSGHKSPRGLCIGGNAVAPPDNVSEIYDVLFYETEWYRPVIAHHRRIRRAFGINTNIYRLDAPPPAHMRCACSVRAAAGCFRWFSMPFSGTITSSLAIFCRGSAVGPSCKRAGAGWRLGKCTSQKFSRVPQLFCLISCLTFVIVFCFQP